MQLANTVILAELAATTNSINVFAGICSYSSVIVVVFVLPLIEGKCWRFGRGEIVFKPHMGFSCRSAWMGSMQELQKRYVRFYRKVSASSFKHLISVTHSSLYIVLINFVKVGVAKNSSCGLPVPYTRPRRNPANMEPPNTLQEPDKIMEPLNIPRDPILIISLNICRDPAYMIMEPLNILRDKPNY